MKLLRKTNRAYFIISATAFIIAGIIIYLFLSFIIEDQLSEKLKADLDNVIRTIEKDSSVPSYYPFVDVRKVRQQSISKAISTDTLLFDDSENERIPYRQISHIKTINGQQYHIVVRDTLLEKSDLLVIIGIVIGLIFVLLNLTLYLINRKLSLRIWKPFYSTLENLKRFSPSDQVFKLHAESEIDEFTELNKTLETLTSKVITDYQSLKRFTEDASHEIQTPLAVIQSKLETLIQYPDLKKDQADLIKSAYGSVQRISKLTQTLLMLTKIANDQFPEKNHVNLSELLSEKIKLFDDHIKSKSLIINQNIAPDIFIETNSILAESTVMNLIGNAVKHSDKEGVINIDLKKNRLEISNTGSPLTVSSEKLFERFYKTDKSSGSHGLGLAIVKEICKLNKWEINYMYSVNKHMFILSF
jgi:two-component system, OmpR family, sensor kinase